MAASEGAAGEVVVGSEVVEAVEVGGTTTEAAARGAEAEAAGAAVVGLQGAAVAAATCRRCGRTKWTRRRWGV